MTTDKDPNPAATLDAEDGLDAAFEAAEAAQEAARAADARQDASFDERPPTINDELLLLLDGTLAPTDLLDRAGARRRCAEHYASARSSLASASEELDAQMRSHNEDVDAAQAALEASPEWIALQAARDAADEHGARIADQLGMVQAQGLADQYKDALVRLYKDGDDKTIPTHAGRVTHRVSVSWTPDKEAV